MASAEGLVVAVIWFDPCVDPERDLCVPAAFERLDRDCCSGLIVAVMASPPCSTVSRARHRRLPGGGGPRPLRSRADPFVPLPHLYPRELRAVALGTHLACACYHLLAAVCLRGGWGAKEHPADPGREPYPSFFHSDEIRHLSGLVDGMTYVLHQCRFGSPAVKPTGIWTVDFGVKSLALKCNHRTPHMMAIGLAQDGTFKTTPLAKYPGPLCQALAERIIYWLVRRHGDRPGASLPQPRAISDSAVRDARAGSPWANRLFPPILLETCRSSVPGCAAQFQQ